MSGFMVIGLVSGWSFTNHSNSVFPGGTCIAQPKWMLGRGILGSGGTCTVSFRPLSSWWWLISSIFLIRISCHKTTHANGYYGTWPGWVVSISVLLLTVRLLNLDKFPPSYKQFFITILSFLPYTRNCDSLKIKKHTHILNVSSFFFSSLFPCSQIQAWPLK